MESRRWIYFLALLLPGISWGTVLLTVPQALSKVCDGKSIVEKKDGYLTSDQIKSINHDLEYKIEEKSTLVTYFECKVEGKLIATAYIDVDRVRKETETLMIVVGIDDNIRDIEVLSFDEPKQYLAPEPWKKQFEGKGAKEIDQSKTNIAGITGATLTSKAVTKSVQKVLAIHKLLKSTDHVKKN